MTSNHKNQKIEDLLLQSQRDQTILEPLLSCYALAAARSNQAFIAHYSKRIIAVCQQWENQEGEIKGIRLLCLALSKYYQARFQEVLVPCREAIEILKDSNYADLYGVCLMIYGATHRSLGELDIAVEYLMKGTEQIALEGELGIYNCYCYYQLAEINVHIKDFHTAEKHYVHVVQLAKALENSTVLFRAYNGLANLYLFKNELNKCKEYLDLSLKIPGLSNAEKGRSYCDLGIYYHKNELYDKAIELLTKSYDLRIESKLEDAASTSLLNLGKTFLKTANLEDAQKSLEEALIISKKYRSKSKLLMCYALLSRLYERQGQWELSTQAYKAHYRLQEEVSSKQLQNIYTLKNDQINKQKLIIEEAHQEITDSIQYAKRLQDAILPPLDEVKKHLPNNFIYFRPKDVVSGDFYWFETSGNYRYIAAADCTGHGVPGAMVSMICSNALYRSVVEFGIKEPAKILDKSRALIMETFAKSSEKVKDGMDIALCAIHNNQLLYSGANNPLWLVRKKEFLSQEEMEARGTIVHNQFALIEHKGNRQPVAFYEEMQSFTQKEIDLIPGDRFYLFTDGFADQFGGPKGKKFLYKPFKRLILEIHEMPLKEQAHMLNLTFEQWKGKLDQVDDVCIIGVRPF